MRDWQAGYNNVRTIERMAIARTHVDPAIVQAAVRGDRRAWATVVEATYPDIYKLCYRMVRNQSDAEDLTQECYVQATTALANFRGKAAIETWLYSIAVNTVRSHWRKKKPQLLEHMPERAGLDDTEATAIIHDEVTTALAAIDRLPEDFKLIIMLRDIEGLTNTEAARVLGVTPVVAKVRLFRAREKLAGELGSAREVRDVYVTGNQHSSDDTNSRRRPS